MRTSSPTPRTSIESNGETVRTPFAAYSEKNAPSTSSREKPHVVCVMSFVPKEKNSAASAIRPAVRAARGSSIIAPIGTLSTTPSRSPISLRISSAWSRTRWSSITEATSGTMISACGSPPAFIRSATASATARTWSANSPGMTRPRRTPRSPSIGLASRIRPTAASSATSCGSAVPFAFARATLTARSV